MSLCVFTIRTSHTDRQTDTHSWWINESPHTVVQAHKDSPQRVRLWRYRSHQLRLFGKFTRRDKILKSRVFSAQHTLNSPRSVSPNTHPTGPLWPTGTCTAPTEGIKAPKGQYSSPPASHFPWDSNMRILAPKYNIQMSKLSIFWFYRPTLHNQRPTTLISVCLWKEFLFQSSFPLFLFPQRPKLIENLPNPGESESRLLEIE